MARRETGFFRIRSSYEGSGYRLRGDGKAGCSEQTARTNGKADGQVPDHGPVTQDGCKDLHKAAFGSMFDMATGSARGALKKA